MDPWGWAGLPALETTAIAAGLAAVVGLERELARKPAGLRTHMLVGADPHPRVVIVGIRFLGAGNALERRLFAPGGGGS